MAKLWGVEYTQDQIIRRVGDMRQLAGVQPFELVEGNERGTRAVRLYNAAGLDLTVIPDRGMAITSLSWKGIPLPLLSSVGAVNPAFSDQGWLRTWPAGFVTPCGLTQVGTAHRDGNEDLGIHGRAASLAARQVRWGSEWINGEYVVWVEGVLHEIAVFGEHLSMRRKIWTRLSEACFWMEDRVTNEGFAPAPHMFLQHFNLGFPLVSAQTRLELPEGEAVARDADAQAGIAAWSEFQEPTPGYREQVFYHDLRADDQGMLKVSLSNPPFDHGRGLRVYWKYKKSDYPILVEWKMMGEGLYVVGVEPANCHVEGRASERQRGTLQMLQPQEARTYLLEVGFE
jgi:hypothetical protein